MSPMFLLTLIFVSPCRQPFVQIGDTYCSYQQFRESFRPREFLNSEAMSLWTEDFNKEGRKLAMHNPLEVKKYAFSCYTTVSIALYFTHCFSVELLKIYKFRKTDEACS